MIYANDEKQRKIKKAIQENKILTILAAVFVAFCCLNCTLIYTFMDLLKNL